MTTGVKNEYVPNNCLGLLFMEPSTLAEKVPLIDALTRKMTAAFKRATVMPIRYRGVHTCVCGAHSDNCNYRIIQLFGQDYITNSLCVHYLARHRNEVPQHDLEIVNSLSFGEEEPGELILNGWNFKVPLNWRV
jgi:hypothetical protein